MQREALIAAQEKLERVDATDPEGGVPSLLALLGAVGPVRRKILDLGCGVGNGVSTLLSQGFDAYGCDIYEYWGEDAELYWERAPKKHERRVLDRLAVAPLEPYRLPYPDGFFDHVISAEVLEHVSDRTAFFSEVARVLKPGATSVHIFPKRWSWKEGHIFVPIPVLCKSRTYLKLMAIAGFRSPRQRRLKWKEVFEANVEQMKISHYPRRSQILKEAKAAALHARYCRADYIKKGGLGWTRLYRRLDRFGAGGAILLVAPAWLEAMLLLMKD